ncbi:tumor necrosis factor receptor superfamily member 6 [Sphaeramia orbicularis]|uniref:tumor necrosis factor receptor superfamily member 6 n=1 Tax=Sphaeramia orbicularis TaxID=375764 RepID=UPI00117C849F|nr:tumor necrosis factor receptor superfamily member 6-like [Sphaeramia orbicularis]
MARKKSRIPIIFTFVLIFVGLSLAIHSSQRKQSRERRQACEEYTYEGRTCCKCGAGLKLKEHCSTPRTESECDLCEDNTFSSVPNSLTTCEPCRPCSQLANLEAATNCTRTSDTVCKCKDHHYCISDTDPCTECRPCTVCDPGVGVKVKCSPTNNTICNEPQGNNVGIGVGIFFILPAFIGVGVFLWMKRKTFPCCGKKDSDSSNNGVVHHEQEMEHLNVNENLKRYIPDIAPEIGWTDMRNIAMGSNIPIGIIESLELDYRQDSQERTIRLLGVWAEAEGREASRKLIQRLRKSSKKGKAERVMEILSVGNSDSSHPPAEVVNID